jgi:hypothetical protein
MALIKNIFSCLSTMLREELLHTTPDIELLTGRLPYELVPQNRSESPPALDVIVESS